MASEIHKKRTGKGFKVSEEIVMKEEMYEEEDEELPRHFRALAAHLQTSSPELNSRVNAYLTNQVALATMARAKEVDRMFAQHFPGAASMGQQLQQSVYFQGLQTDSYGAPASPAYSGASHNSPSPVLYSSHPPQSQSAIHPSPLSTRTDSNASYLNSPTSQQTPLSDPSSSHASPPLLSPGSGSIDSSSTSTPQFTFAQHDGNLAPPTLYRGQSSQSPHLSAFTSELSHEAKLFGGLDPNDTMTGHFYGMHDGMMGSNGFDMGQYGDASDDSSYVKPHHQQHQEQGQQRHQQPCYSNTNDYFQPSQPTSKFLNLQGQDSRIGTPGGGEGDPWNLWVNDDAGFNFTLNDVKQA